MTRLKHWYRLGFSVLLATAATACAANGPSGEGSDSDEPAVDEAEAPSALDTDGAKGKHRGQDKMFRLALKELDLTADQRTTIEGLAPDATESHAGMKSFMAALASGVRSGTIDQAKIDAELDAMQKSATAGRAKHAAALEKLHATLTPAQRTTLADKMRAKMAAKEEKFAEKRERFAEGGEGRDFKGKKGPLGHLMRELDLSDTQRDAVKKAMADAGLNPPDHDAMKAKFEAIHTSRKAMVDAFATDSFDADKFLPEADGKGREHLGQMVTATKATLPILSVEQREKLAGLLESGDLGWRGKHGKRGKGRAPAPEAE